MLHAGAKRKQQWRMPEPTFDELIEAMKAAAGLLQQSEIPFVLGGGLSAWARGGPKSEHDVDFLVMPEDADADPVPAITERRLTGRRPGFGARRYSPCPR